MKKNIYAGLITALITPFKDGKIDYSSLKNLINLQIKAGVNALVIAGSTGEGSSIDEHDYFELIEQATRCVNKQVPVIAGITTVSTDQALDKIKKLEKLAIEGIMCTPPQYIKPEQEGLVRHFKMVNDTTDLQIILYSNPGRTGVDFSDDTLIKLAALENIVALKDAGNDIERPLRLTTKLPPHFNMLTGDDSKAVAYSAHGGRGCVSVVSNVLPEKSILLQNYLKDENFVKARMLQQELLTMYEAIFAESNPIGIKCAAALMKLCSPEIKLPLTPARPGTQSKIETALKEFGKL